MDRRIQQSQQQWRDVITRGLITRKRSGAMRADSPGVMDNGPDHPELSGDHWRDWPTDYHFNSAGICHFQLKCSGFVGRRRGGGERPICCMAVRASVLLLFGWWDVGGGDDKRSPPGGEVIKLRRSDEDNEGGTCWQIVPDILSA